jgi:hypothetical protein
MAAPRVFVSMGTPYTEEFGKFRDELDSLLRNTCGVDPRIIGKNEYPAGNPLTHIYDVMRSCHGVIVVAYERKFLESGVEKRGGDAAQSISRRTYTTPWNDIESAMAYSLGIPLYVLCQKGLSEEGLIESKLDWFVQYVEISPAALRKSRGRRIHTRVGEYARAAEQQEAALAYDTAGSDEIFGDDAA